MEDRFKFRFWDKNRQKMETYEHNLSSLGVILFSKNPDKIPMQCTGLKDKNGKLIYEGDILSKVDSNALGYHRERVCEVSWDKEYLYYKIMTTLGDGYALSDFESNQLEVIDNIHEHKDLLNA